MINKSPVRTARSMLILFIALCAVFPLSLFGQDRLYWDFPESIDAAYGGRYSELVVVGDRIALIWQEFSGDRDQLNATISIKAQFSDDGTTWNGPVVSVTEELPYRWLQEVQLFSADAGPDGNLIVAVAAGSEGIAVYRQESSGGPDTFSRSAIIPPGSENADVPVAPRLAVRPDDGYILFLTRRTAVPGITDTRNQMLTIFSAESENGRTWSNAELFVSLDQDRAIDGEILDQNFLPSYLASGDDEYVVFQSLRTSTYQLYLKQRSYGGEWTAAVPVTEDILPEGPGSIAAVWDNQRPSLGFTSNNELLISWERRTELKASSIAAAVFSRAGTPISESVETVSSDSSRSAFSSKIIYINGTDWILWFDSSGIRIASRTVTEDPLSITYNIQAASLDGLSEGSDQNSARFPGAAEFQGNTYLVWEDLSGSVPRTIFLRPDLQVNSPGLRATNFVSGRPGNNRTVSVDWNAPQDSSGILSHSWVWSRNPLELPSRDEVDQIYEGNRATLTFDNLEDEEGSWYFSLIARDLAGNWSDPLRLSYILDVTPPPPPLVRNPSTSRDGFLISNSFTLEWDDGEQEQAAYYRWRRDYLAGTVDDLSLDIFATQEPLPLGTVGVIETSERRISQSNIDNGIWAYSIAAVDIAGNVGLPNTQILLANRYVPVTYISLVSDRKDENDRLILDVRGRGFTAGGILVSGIIDSDGVEPWDYEFTRETGQLTVFNDIRTEFGPIDDMREGTYFIGVRHPSRGVVFWDVPMRLDSTGNVKFGPFGIYAYESLWKPAALSLHLTGNQFLILIILLLALTAVVMTAFRLASISREMRSLETDATAILNNTPMTAEARKDAAMIFRKKGMGLQLKFTLMLTALVFVTVLIIAGFLGLRWLNKDRDTLAEGLESESRLLVEMLASSAANIIPAADRGSLLLLPDRIEALADAVWTTLTGPRSESGSSGLRATSDGYKYVWATNDPDVLYKIEFPETLSDVDIDLALNAAGIEEVELLERYYLPETGGLFRLLSEPEPEERPRLASLLQRNNLMPLNVGIGTEILVDELSDSIRQIRENVLEEARDADMDQMITTLNDLQLRSNEELKRVILSGDFTDPDYLEAEQAKAAQRKLIQTKLLEISNNYFSVYPEFSADALGSDDADIFIFYKPVLYLDGENPDIFKGVVRLAVSVGDINETLVQVQRQIILITLGAAIAALAIGVVVALLISMLMLRPIRALVTAVSKIRDEPDMLKYEDFAVTLNTQDELSELANSINGMVRGLFHAALEQKELVAGQEIQKTFLPLEKDEKTGKKLSTGGAGNAYFNLFGYYEGADAVSGDYFDFRQLDEDHYVMIKLDIAGHGVTASLIMVQVAALYVDYFRKVRNRAQRFGHLEYDLRDFTFGINDLINEIGFTGRFAAFNLSVINVRTSEYEMINAGDNLVRVFNAQTRTIEVIELPDGPAAGQIDSELIKMTPTMYSVVKGSLKRGDILFLYTDGIEEAHHILRNEKFEVVTYRDFDRSVVGKDQEFIEPTYETKPERMNEKGELVETPTLEDKIDAALNEELQIRGGSSKYKQINAGQDNEEFDTARIDDIIVAAMNKGKYTLNRRCDITIGKALHFDFSTLKGTGEDVILALASVEKVFRIIPDTSGGTAGRVRVDQKIVEFLKEHFAEFKEFYGHQVDEDAGYVYFSHLKEDVQDDDLTLWAYERL